MDYNALGLARNIFKLRVHEARGQAYEDLFVKVMQYSVPSFAPVKASGRLGDKKNDGYSSDSGTYYQVYAPETLGEREEKTALDKLADFKELKDYWDSISPVRRFIFVLNDRYFGSSPAVHKAVAKIQKEYELEEAKQFAAQHLEERFASLTDDQIVTIVGHLPAMEPADYHFLNGFTYFISSWIAFERSARRLAEQQGLRPRSPTRQVLEHLARSNALDSRELGILTQANSIRNPLVHGDSNELPRRELTEDVVAIAEKLARSFDASVGDAAERT